MPEGFSIVEGVNVAVEGLKSVLPLVTEFPINIYVGFGILSFGLGLYKFFKRR